MATTTTLKNWAQSIRKFWSILASLAGLIVSVVGGFLQPVGASEQDRNVLLRFTPFLVTVLAGFIFLIAQSMSQKNNTRKWFITSVTTFVLAVAVWLLYQNFVYTRTGEYDDRRVIIGTEYTQRGLNHLRENPGITHDRLLDDFIGETEAIWTKESINESRLFLEITYIGGIVLFAICLLSLGQALYSLDKAKKKGLAQHT